MLLMLPALMQVVPPVVLCLSLGGAIGSGAFLWAAIVTITNVLWWVLVYGWLKLSPLYVLLHPIGAALMLYIALYSIVRGRRVRWKGRDYVST